MTPSAQKPRIAIAIVSWNTRDLLARCLRSLEGDARAELIDVWVVDNASTDGSPDLVRREFGWVKLVASDENLGFGRAVNLVARQTSTEWIAPANADIAMRPDTLRRLLKTGDRHPNAGVIAPRLVLPAGDTQHSVFAFPTIPFAVALNMSPYRRVHRIGDRFALPGVWDSTRARWVPWAIAAFLLVRRAAWDAVGGFDERQWMYAEDLDLGWRLREAGWPTWFEPSAVVDHESSASTTQAFGPELAPVWQRSTYGFMARRFGLVRTRSVAALNLLGSSARWLAMLPISVLRPAKRPEHRALGRWVMVHARALGRGKALESYR